MRACLNVFIKTWSAKLDNHDDVIKWKQFPRYWLFVRVINRPPGEYPHKGQWRGLLVFSLICVWIKGWVNSRVAGDLGRYRAHYDATFNVGPLLLAVINWDCCMDNNYMHNHRSVGRIIIPPSANIKGGITILRLVVGAWISDYIPLLCTDVSSHPCGKHSRWFVICFGESGPWCVSGIALLFCVLPGYHFDYISVYSAADRWYRVVA